MSNGKDTTEKVRLMRIASDQAVDALDVQVERLVESAQRASRVSRDLRYTARELRRDSQRRMPVFVIPAPEPETEEADKDDAEEP